MAKKIARSAATGKFVSKNKAKANPKTTVVETVKHKKASSGKTGGTGPRKK